MEEIKALLPVLGPTAGVVIVVICFLRYLATESKRTKDSAMAEAKLHRDAVKIIVDKIEQINDDTRKDSKTMMVQLVAINSRTMKTMGDVSARVAELSSKVGELGHVIERISVRMDTLDAFLASVKTPEKS